MSALFLAGITLSFLAGIALAVFVSRKERKTLQSEINASLDEIARLERELSNVRLTNQNLLRRGYNKSHGFRS